ncbi:MAG: type II toxin-antitoxin system HipA family toxin [Pseudonocardia sp.]
MTPPEHCHAVWLHGRWVGTLHQRGDYSRFVFAPDYLTDPERPVLGLIFEQDLTARHAAALRLPCWFSNLLPEGRLRDWIAADRGVSPQREMELLAHVGHDLPGAVRVTEVEEGEAEPDWAIAAPPEPPREGRWRFSLAGVALKFSMLAKGDRLTMPAFGAGGDWIVKLPDATYPDVPRNEFTMMSLAGAVGIDVPDVRLVHRDEIDGLPSGVWPNREEWAYAVRRFDRGADRVAVHIEDLAQVRNVYPDYKYHGNYETVAGLIYRGRDLDGLREFTRRLTLTILISNGDAHLKNWSLIYTDPRAPALAPAYDLVSTRPYLGDGEELGMKFAGSRRFETVWLGTFDRLERRLGVEAGLADEAATVVARVVEQWPRFADTLDGNPELQAAIASSITDRSRSLRWKAGQ